ncbi:MAG: Hsp33 family molecular chaperone HslO [Peptoniphilus sp.]|nr:Hsp33 family molecular chaperone HslO [Peptoniphilus sp.]
MDYLVKAIDAEGFVRISAVRTTDLVEKARVTHDLSKTASAALGRTLSAGLIMADDLKNEGDSITININCDGALEKIVVTGKNDGKIKGYVNNPHADADIREVDNKLDVSKIVGGGTLTVVKDLGLKEPYVGQVDLVSGEIAEDFANYFAVSDQVPTVVNLGVLVDKDLSIKAAGGFILSLMPGAGEEIISRIEANVAKMESLTALIDRGYSPEDIILEVLAGFDVKFLGEKPVEFKCDCSREKVIESLISIGEKEMTKIIEEDGKAEVECYFCNTTYDFDKKDLEEILKEIKKI